MKKLNHSHFSPLSYLNQHKRFKSLTSIFLSLAFLHLTIGCSYYKVQDITTTEETMAKEIDDFNKMGRYAVMHSGEHTWHLENLVVNEDKQELTGTVQVLSTEHQYSIPRKKSGNRYKKENRPMDEIHFNLHTTFQIPEIGQKMSIPFSQINSISLNKRDGGTEFAYIMLGTVGVLAGIFLIILATKSSCPFVYVKNGEVFDFAGELYPGMITPQIQKDDYLPLYTDNQTEFVKIKITNELKEIQYTDLVQLLVAEHPNNVEVLLDNKGNPFTFSDIKEPIEAINDNFQSELAASRFKDGISHTFNNHTDDITSVRSINFEFKNSIDAQTGKLYLRIKNSFWLDYAFGKFNSQFGDYYNTFQKNQQNASNEKSQKWINEQHIPLSIYLYTSEGWQLIDKINAVGPLAFRNIVVPIPKLPSKEKPIQIKLETGFMFWEVDYVGIDFSENLKLRFNTIEATEAVDEHNTNVRKLIAKADEVYLVQPNIGNEVNITFPRLPVTEGYSQSLFLKNRGYYNYIRDYKGKPDFQKLKLFKAAGSFTEFSKLEYEAMIHFSDRDDLALNDEQ